MGTMLHQAGKTLLSCMSDSLLSIDLNGHTIRTTNGTGRYIFPEIDKEEIVQFHESLLYRISLKCNFPIMSGDAQLPQLKSNKCYLPKVLGY